jgi:hypothetical protein
MLLASSVCLYFSYIDATEQDLLHPANKGKVLSRLPRSRGGKLPIVIPRGRTRPESALIAAKFATECNIAIRNHVHVRTHWKDYREDTGLLCDFIGKVAVSTYCIPFHVVCCNIPDLELQNWRTPKCALHSCI